MSDLQSPLGKMVGPEGSPNTFERHAKAFVRAGGAILHPYQMDALSPSTRAEIEAAMKKAYGKGGK